MRTPRIEIRSYMEPSGTLPELPEDVLRGLTARPRRLSPKYFYDDRGSLLFERICRTPEYYPTRTETAILDAAAPEIATRVRPQELVELGPGAARKTRILLDALREEGSLERYVPVDVSLGMVRQVAKDLATDYPGLAVRGVVGDFHRHLDKVPRRGARLVAFLGSTIGNLVPARASALLRGIAANLGPRDAFLLGVDLVKDPKILEAAYNDSRGVTAAFNRNILHVINRHLGADFVPRRFAHVAFYNRSRARIEIHLEAQRDHEVHVRDLDLRVRFRKGDRICTEHSHKFTRRSVRRILGAAGMWPEAWFTDPRRWFAVVLARRAAPRPA